MKIRYTTTIGPETLQSLEAIRKAISKKFGMELDVNDVITLCLKSGMLVKAKEYGTGPVPGFKLND